MPDLLNLRVVDMEELASKAKGRPHAGPYRLRALPQGEVLAVPPRRSHLFPAQAGDAGSSAGEGGCNAEGGE